MTLEQAIDLIGKLQIREDAREQLRQLRNALVTERMTIERLRAELAAASKRLENALNEGAQRRSERDALRAELAIVRAAVIEECAMAMNPSGWSMISRAEAALIIRALAKTGDKK